MGIVDCLNGLIVFKIYIKNGEHHTSVDNDTLILIDDCFYRYAATILILGNGAI